MPDSTRCMVLGDKTMNKLIDAWVLAQKFDVESREYDDLSWAVDELFELAYSEPGKLIHIVTEILKIDSSEKVVGALGAGVLEEVIVHHGEKCMDDLVVLAGTNERLMSCFRFTFLDEDDVSPRVYEEFQKLKADALSG